MNKLLGLVRRCAEDYRMISPGDRICVGVSGGKDSLTLLVLLAKLRDFYPAPFELCAVTIDMGLGMDFTPVAGLCRELDIPYECVRTEIGPIIFDYRKEKNPCSMCAKIIINAGIREIVYDEGYVDDLSNQILSETNIIVRRYEVR